MKYFVRLVLLSCGSLLPHFAAAGQLDLIFTVYNNFTEPMKLQFNDAEHLQEYPSPGAYIVIEPEDFVSFQLVTKGEKSAHLKFTNTQNGDACVITLGKRHEERRQPEEYFHLEKCSGHFSFLNNTHYDSNDLLARNFNVFIFLHPYTLPVPPVRAKAGGSGVFNLNEASK